jgi:hypothetical protein
MQLGEFHSLVSRNVKRGSTLDAEIVVATRQAAKALERRFTFLYMKKDYTETLPEGANAISNWTVISQKRIKSILSAQISYQDEVFFLLKTDRRDLLAVTASMPKYYWFTAAHEVFFDRAADQDYAIKFQIAAYSEWPTALTAEPEIFDIAEDVVLYKTMMNMAPHMRDPEILQTYGALFSEEIKTWIEAEVDKEEQNTDHTMHYGRLW